MRFLIQCVDEASVQVVENGHRCQLKKVFWY